MTESISLFNEIKQGGYDACLVSTFSIDFPFYEDVLLRKMQSAGISHHMLFVDKGMCLQSMEDRPPVKAGSHYVLAPMTCSGAFHPKVMLLLGKNKGLLAVGSHNLTLSGFGQNLEITNVIRFSKNSNEDYLEFFKQAFYAFQDWATGYGSDLPDVVLTALERTLNLCPWLNTTNNKSESQYHFLYTSLATKTLWQQLEKYLPSNIKEVVGISAFFDKKLIVMDHLSDLSQEKPIIAIQENTVSAPENFVDRTDLKIVDICSVEKVHQEKSYVHAKMIYFSGETDLLVSGSANLSRPAWLDSTTRSNAEAVIVIEGEEASDIADSLGLKELVNAKTVKKISSSSYISNDDIEYREKTKLLSIEDKGEEVLKIPRCESWNESITFGYQNTLSKPDMIEFERIGEQIHICRDNIRLSELICVFSNENLVIARIILINIADITSNSSAGKERQLQQALGSLGGDMPDMNSLFLIFQDLMKDEEDSSTVKSNNGAKGSNTESNDSSEPDTLITSLSNENKRIVEKSGRYRSSTGNLAFYLDMLIYNLGLIGKDSAIAYGEDTLGRNEEDLINSDDDTLLLERDQELINETQKINDVCQRKINTILNRLATTLKSKGIPLETSLPLTLATLALMNKLYVAEVEHNNGNSIEKIKRQWVSKDAFLQVTEILFLNFFENKTPLDLEEMKQDPLYLSDEWAKVLAYTVWATYHAGIDLRARLPLSASNEDRDKNIWANACWLFLSQRLSADKKSYEEANELFSQEGEKANSWLSILVHAGKEILKEKRMPFDVGFSLASSHKNAFIGLRLVCDESSQFTTLANINSLEKVSRFQQGALDVSRRD